MKYFYDASAIYEYIRDTPGAAVYFEEPNEGVVSLLVVMEVYFIILRDFKEDVAEKALKMFFPLIALPSKAIIRNSMKFRLENQNRGLSYADALGYVYAKEHNIPFLTADRAFKGLNNVVFVR